MICHFIRLILSSTYIWPVLFQYHKWMTKQKKNKYQQNFRYERESKSCVIKDMNSIHKCISILLFSLSVNSILFLLISNDFDRSFCWLVPLIRLVTAGCNFSKGSHHILINFLLRIFFASVCVFVTVQWICIHRSSFTHTYIRSF